MDLSKLPRLSESDKQGPIPSPADPAQQVLPPPQQVLEYSPRYQSSGGGEIWLSAILGAVFMMMGWNFARFVLATLSGQPFQTGWVWPPDHPKAGQQVAYFELQGYTAWTETAIFLFGLAMVLEAVVLAFARSNAVAARLLLRVTLVVTVGMTLFNLVVVGLLLQTGITPIQSILAVAFGGYMAMAQWSMLKDMAMQMRA